MLKANEFEHGVDDGPYNVHKSFQQLYGPEANYSYRADSAKEILEDIGKLTAIGVDYISSGALTHSAPILDISMKNLHAV